MWRSLNKLHFDTFWGVVRSVHGKGNVKWSTSVAQKFEGKHVPQICYNKKSSDGKKEQGYDGTKRSGAFNYVKDDYLEAFGWSGVIFLSWYIWFPCCPRRIASNPAERYAYKCLPKCSTQEYTSLVKCISTFILDTPVNYVLPKVSATKSRPSSPTETDENEVLRKDCENLEAAHKKVTSSLSNWLGTECMQSGKYKEAFSHFSEAASSNHAAALFNLGLCHEMGLGTPQCFRRAAELYKKASELGHATAMYNLGVFHVHGWGGVEANSIEAHDLFAAAAELGQIDAKRALHWQQDESSQDQSDTDSEDIPSGHQSFFQEVVELKNNEITDVWLKVLNIKLDNVMTEPAHVSKSERLMSTDSGVNDLSPTNDLEIYLK